MIVISRWPSLPQKRRAGSRCSILAIPIQVEYKGEFNPVTEVDRLCEQAIVKMISDAFPDHDILTEESPFEEKGSPWKWIIDPLDGTTNYFHGFPCFCVSIGLEVEGEVRLGVVYIPPLMSSFMRKKARGLSQR